MYALDLYLAVVFLVGLWAVLPLFWMLVQKQLPSKKVYALIAVLQDADDVFHFCVEGGLLDVATAMDLHARLAALHNRVDALRLRALQATTLWQDLMNMRRGLSHEMARLIRDVRGVRARISAVSYVELQNVQLRTIDGKEVAQLRCELIHESLSVLAPASDSALRTVAAPSDFSRASKTEEKAVVVLRV